MSNLNFVKRGTCQARDLPVWPAGSCRPPEPADGQVWRSPALIAYLEIRRGQRRRVTLEIQNWVIAKLGSAGPRRFRPLVLVWYWRRTGVELLLELLSNSCRPRAELVFQAPAGALMVCDGILFDTSSTPYAQTSTPVRHQFDTSSTPHTLSYSAHAPSNRRTLCQIGALSITWSSHGRHADWPARTEHFMTR